jgi:hypothetical protein
MFVGGSDAGYYWVPYDPANATHTYFANLYHRYGRGLSQYYWHGRDAESFPDLYWQAAFHQPLVFGSMQHLDTWYHPRLLNDIEAIYRQGPGGGGPVCGNNSCEPGETPQTCPADCPKPSLCDGICQVADKICDQGKVIGGRCPADCEAPCEGSTVGTECDAEDCAPLIKPVQDSLNACKAEKDNLAAEVQKKDQTLAAQGAELKTLRTQVGNLRAEVQKCTAEKNSLTADLQKKDQTLAAQETELKSLRTQVTDLQAKLDAFKLTKVVVPPSFFETLRFIKKGTVTIRDRPDRELRKIEEFLHSLDQRQCLAAP